MRVCDFCGNEMKKPSENVHFVIDGVLIVLKCIYQDMCPACIDEVESKMREAIKEIGKKDGAKNDR